MIYTNHPTFPLTARLRIVEGTFMGMAAYGTDLTSPPITNEDELKETLDKIGKPTAELQPWDDIDTHGRQ